MSGEGLSYCAQELRARDRDRFLACLFAPAEQREALFALYAFNLEVAKTAEVVSEPMLGQIRLQWWREALDQAYGAGPLRKHQVAAPLGAAIRAHGLERADFERLIDAREADLDPAPPADLAGLERYAADTSATLQGLALAILGVADDAAEAAARQVGIAWALTGLLRAVPFHARQKRPVPAGGSSGGRRGGALRTVRAARLAGPVRRGDASGAPRPPSGWPRRAGCAPRSPGRRCRHCCPRGWRTATSRAWRRPRSIPSIPRVQQELPGRALKLWWGAARRRY